MTLIKVPTRDLIYRQGYVTARRLAMSLLLRSLFFCAVSLNAFAQGNDPFPMVEKTAQIARDADRRAILEAEFAAERQALDAARAVTKQSSDDGARAEVHRHEENVKALQRELERTGQDGAVRISARRSQSDAAPPTKRAMPGAAPAPFWDVYRRSAAPNDFQPQ
jgi:hypothetical protein